MVQKDARTIQAELTRPFAPEDLEWRLQRTYDDRQTGKKCGIAVPYVTNRAIQARLDDVVGPDGWYNEYKPWHSDGKKNAQICGISIYFPEKGFKAAISQQDARQKPRKPQKTRAKRQGGREKAQKRRGRAAREESRAGRLESDERPQEGRGD